jgi:lipid II:glycine glycyltransferase (peptidoglycan interpeptide bridge formation enzyme)
MPFGTYGGPIVSRDCENPSDARRRLLEAYTEIAHDGRVLISDLTWYQGDLAELPAGQLGEMISTHVIPLADDFAAMFQALPHSVRSRVHQAEAQGVIVSRTTRPEDIRAFHALTVRGLGRLGVRAKPLSLYQRILERLVPAGLARYDLVRHDEVTIGGSLHFLYHGVATNWLTVADERYLRLRPNHVLIARLMKELSEAGFHEYHLGVSPPGADGLVEFKKSWGARPHSVLGLRHGSLLHRILRG